MLKGKEYLHLHNCNINLVDLETKTTFFHKDYWHQFKIKDEEFRLYFSFDEMVFYLVPCPFDREVSFNIDDKFRVIIKNINTFISVLFEMLSVMKINYFRYDLVNNKIDRNMFSFFLNNLQCNPYFLELIKERGFLITNEYYNIKNQWVVFKNENT